MPSFRVHIGVSAFIGLAGAAVGITDQAWSHPVAMVAGLAGALGGLLPDLDADEGRPLRTVGIFVSLFLSIGLLYVLLWQNLSPGQVILTGAALLFVFNSAGIGAFKTLTRHRGMFHSLPAVLVWGAALAIVAFPLGRPAALRLAAVGAAGYLSHLILDAVFSLSLKTLKLWSKSRLASTTSWVMAAGLILVMLHQYSR